MSTTTISWGDLEGLVDALRAAHPRVDPRALDDGGAAYAAWKWLCDRTGADVDAPPAPRPVPEALALEVAVTNWTELMAALLTIGRAQGLLFADLAAAGGDAARRAFDRVGRDY